MNAYRSILAALCCLASVAHAEEWNLTTCQREAGYHSPMLGAARARWNQMRARTRLDYAEQLPTIGLNADYARSEFADSPGDRPSAELRSKPTRAFLASSARDCALRSHHPIALCRQAPGAGGKGALPRGYHRRG